ncbi:phosphatase 3 regulatory subunit [Schistosoma japonicum]|nr:phosphatase 3 regulatory subunit [Schistosoma japonicum]KAH8866634.1 phosphatase 3 regulatory subunit [Schistosoma japonicum]
MSYKTVMDRKIAELKKRFQELDKNNDGAVTLQEFEKELTDQGYPQCLAAKFMKKFDHDCDGKITLEEFIKTLTCTDDNAFQSRSE